MWQLSLTSIDRSTKKRSIIDPPGFTVSTTTEEPTKPKDSLESIEKLKIKKAWDVALSPLKSIPMNGFMLWMSGSSVQIFSIMITIMLLWNSFNAIINSLLQFEQFYAADVDTSKGTIYSLTKSKLVAPVVVYVLIQFANLGLGVWKCGQMGLLPTTTSDWLAFMEPKEMLEHAIGGYAWK